MRLAPPENFLHPISSLSRTTLVMCAKPHSSSPRWPFWLLIAAWGCANTPQVAVYTGLAWLAEAQSFSHQHRLSTDVAFVLAGKPTPQRIARAVKSTPSRPMAPVPAEAVVKKIPLAFESVVEVLPPALRASRPALIAWACPESLRAPPPHGPPRLG